MTFGGNDDAKRQSKDRRLPRGDSGGTKKELYFVNLVGAPSCCGIVDKIRRDTVDREDGCLGYSAEGL